MSETTALDRAHATMIAAGETPEARLACYEVLARSILHVLIGAPDGPARPEVFALDEGPVALAFDTEARLVAFTAIAAPHAALTGRALLAWLAESGLGLGVNLGAPSALLLGPEAVSWLADALATGPQEADLALAAFHPPGALPAALLAAVEARLAAAGGLAQAAFLAAAEEHGGTMTPLLAFVSAAPGAESALARAVNDAVRLVGAGRLDVAFIPAGSVQAEALARVGLRIDLPKPAFPEPAFPDTACSGDAPVRPSAAPPPPQAPPRLR